MGLFTYPSPSRPRQSHPQPGVELDVSERLLRSAAKVVNSIHKRRPPVAPVLPRSCARRSLGSRKNYNIIRNEKERKGRASALPDSGPAVMVMFVRGGAECAFCAGEKCGLKVQVGARPCMFTMSKSSRGGLRTCINTYIFKYIHTCMHTHTYIRTHMPACMHVCIYAYTHMHTYISGTHTCIHTHMHTYLRTYIHSGKAGSGQWPPPLPPTTTHIPMYPRPTPS